ncbi:MAG: GNAT family N-acetyltransferase, partial [Gemmatimonadota bacterium]
MPTSPRTRVTVAALLVVAWASVTQLWIFYLIWASIGVTRAYEKAGFTEIGRRRQCLWLAGRPWDLIYMDCLATEFTSPVLG